MSEVILVIGASGLLGRQVFKILTEKTQFKVIGTAFKNVSDPLLHLDSTKPEELENMIHTYKVTIIINCAAVRNPDQVAKEKKFSEDLNVHSVESLCKLCQEYHIYFIHISTDYVFDGTKPPYNIGDKPNPLNDYGKLKYQSEQICMKYYSFCTIIRIPILYGPTQSLKESAVTILYNSILSKSPQIDDIAIRYPTYTPDVALFLYYLIVKYKNNNEYKGILHFSAMEPFTKYQIALEMCSILHMDSSHIIVFTQANKTESTQVLRPKDAHLYCNYIIDDQPFPYTPFRNGLTEIFRENHLLPDS